MESETLKAICDLLLLVCVLWAWRLIIVICTNRNKYVSKTRVFVLAVPLVVVYLVGVYLYVKGGDARSPDEVMSTGGLFLAGAVTYIVVHLMRSWVHQGSEQRHQREFDIFLGVLLVASLLSYIADDSVAIGISLAGGILLDFVTDGLKYYLFGSHEQGVRPLSRHTAEQPEIKATKITQNNRVVTTILVLLLLNPRYWR